MPFLRGSKPLKKPNKTLRGEVFGGRGSIDGQLGWTLGKVLIQWLIDLKFFLVVIFF